MGKKRHKAAGRTASRASSSTTRVIIGPPKDGRHRAQIAVGVHLQPLQWLDDFCDAVKSAFGTNPRNGQVLPCNPTENPRPQTVSPQPGAKPQESSFAGRGHGGSSNRQHPLHGRRQHGNVPQGSNQRPVEQVELADYESDGEGLNFCPPHTDRNNRPIKVESLKVTDRFLAARPGSIFQVRGSELKLVKYAPDIVHDLNDEKPDIDENPYNFVPWIEHGPRRAEEPLDASHDKRRRDRLSGSIDVTFTARTPVFVPAGQLEDGGSADTAGNNSPPRDFFHLWDGKCERYAIPGASVKGVVRSLFEALTNSRAGVTDESALGKPPLYRRRSFKLFKIVSLPAGPKSPGKVTQCDYGLCDANGCWNPRTRDDLPAPAQHNDVHEASFAANLFWVNPVEHLHRWKKIRYRSTGEDFSLDWETVERFKSMKKHPHLKAHGGKHGNAANASKKFYRDPPPDYSSRIGDRLLDLKVGNLVFGIPKNGRIHCFGRNVNFLWPADKSAVDMMGKFAARAPDESSLLGSDPAEATFGFAGTHRGDSHPFRARVRFGTFWGPKTSDETLGTRACLQLMPLTSPSGTKAKSRPLYLTPGNGGRSADHDKEAQLRGRKFYWHQKGNDHDVPSVHRFDELSKRVPTRWKEKIESQLPAPIKPLPVSTRFSGKIPLHQLD